MIKLDLFSEKDIPDLLSWLHYTDEEFLLQFAGPGYSYPLDKEQIIATLCAEDYMAFCAREDSSGELLGHCQFMRINRDKAKATIGRVLVRPEQRGQGIGSAMIKALIEKGRKEGLAALGLRVFDFNTSAYNCYKKSGFQETGREDIFFESIHKTWTCISMERKL